MRYPITIDGNGVCSAVVEDIPDFSGARIMGKVQNAKMGDAMIFH